MSGYAPALALLGFVVLAVIPWHPTCPLFEGARLPCAFAPPLRHPTTLELASLMLFTAVLALLPLEFPNPVAMIVLGLTACAVIIAINFSFEAYLAALRIGFVDFNQEARYGLLLLFPSSAALIVAGVFRLVAALLSRSREA